MSYDLVMSELHDGPDAGSGGGPAPAAATPAASPTPAPATSGQPAAAAPATPSAVSTQPPATGGPDGWVPSYRIRETREAATRELNNQFAQREAQYRAELERVQAQVRALTGVTPPPNPEIDQVRQQFGSLFPGLSRLEALAEQIEEMTQRAGDVNAQNEHYWQTYGRTTMDRLFEYAARDMGAPLSDEAKRTLHSSFVGFVQSSPQLIERYASDPSIVEDFWKGFTTSFIFPAQRTSAAAAATRTGTPVPQDRPGAAIPPMAQPPKPKDLDERVAAGLALYQSKTNNAIREA